MRVTVSALLILAAVTPAGVASAAPAAVVNWSLLAEDARTLGILAGLSAAVVLAVWLGFRKMVRDADEDRWEGTL